MKSNMKKFVVFLMALLFAFLALSAQAGAQGAVGNPATPSQQQQATAPGAVPQSLQDKIARLQTLAQKREQEGVDMQPIAEIANGIGPLMEQQKFSEAEALVDRVLKLLGDPSTPPEQQPATPVPQGDEAAIKQLVTNFENAFSSHDAHAVAQLFTAEADYTSGYAITLHGQKAIEDHLTPLFVGGALKTIQMKISVRDVQFVTPEVAIVNSDLQLSGMKRPDGTDAPAPVGFFDWVVTKQNGQWLIAGFHESLRPPSPQSPPPAAH